ncbi:MAG: class I SAM-dependent methyltransferase [Actinomycetota bacterium]|nr:class I SAM-dependent methyltransferase [Actinomycetota bacterium]
MGTIDDIRRYWDEDAATYDDARQHRPTDPAVVAAWTAAVESALAPGPSRVLDCGAGTGFLSLVAARLGHEVTALDLSCAMLERLSARAAAEGLEVRTLEGAATDPPAGPFDAVMERHLLWTLPDPVAALCAWREAAPDGRLVLVESLWGGTDPVEQLRATARRVLDRLRHAPPEHHAQYPAAMKDSLPLSAGTHPAALAALAAAAGWRSPSLRRLRDVEWAERLASPLPERLLGSAPRFVLTAR